MSTIILAIIWAKFIAKTHHLGNVAVVGHVQLVVSGRPAPGICTAKPPLWRFWDNLGLCFVF